MTFVRGILALAVMGTACCGFARQAHAQTSAPARAARAARPVARRATAVKQPTSQEVLPDPFAPPTRPEALPASPQSEPAPGITLEELECIAFSSNPTLIQANAAIRSAQGQYVQSGLPPNPNIGWSSMMINDAGTAGQQGPYFEQMFILGGKLRLSRAVESQRVRQAVARRDGQVMAVLNDVRTGYYNVLVAQRALQLTQQLVEIGDAGIKAADDLLKAEQVSRVDLLQARIEAQSARIQYRNAHNRLAAAWRSLTAVMGAPSMPATRVAGEIDGGLPTLEWEASLWQILAASPELAEAQAGVSRAQYAVARARRQPFPDADVQYYPQRDYAGAQDVHSVQAYLVVPLWNQNQGNIRAAQADLTSAQAEVKRVELDLHNRLAAAFERYANARQQVDAYARQILPDAQESLDLVGNGYRNEQFSYIELLTAQRTYFNTNLAYLSALQALRENTVAIEGLLLTGNLEKSLAK